MAGFSLDLGPAKEPLGFIKFLQWIFSIFAFATCGGYSGKTSILLACKNAINVTWTRDFSYPFRLSKISFGPLVKEENCNNTWDSPSYLVGDFSSSAEFYVTFAVLVFLYCIAALILYLGYMHLYRGAGKLPLIDFIFTVIITFLWLVSTSAWAKALVDIKASTGPGIVMGNNFCHSQSPFCHFNEIRRMGSLNVSVVVGFLNLILWAGGAWFVYKETNLHSPPSSASPNATSSQSPPGM
ncbi:synaptophysin-like protein 1 [Erythrolamprus reginae]|uniref:synaptophysin-like protein 1 n=1 Tax=Erythrolamprus reginae TaxID=121349 RepID=UPI00396C8C4B